jgi:hypothetical protein
MSCFSHFGTGHRGEQTHRFLAVFPEEDLVTEPSSLVLYKVLGSSEQIRYCVRLGLSLQQRGLCLYIEKIDDCCYISDEAYLF